jgi:glutathione S-transferase
LVSLQLFGHPFSSYTWKVLIALWADETPFEFRMLGPDHPENGDELRRRWPFGQFPLLIDGDRSVVEATCIIEHLQAHHPGPNRWIPDGELGRRVRFLDRVFDLRVMANMQAVVFDALRPAEHQNPADRNIARERLRTAYDWLEANLDQSPWAIGEQFTLADCAAAPSLFYADWVEEIEERHPQLKAYRARLLAHPVVARAVDEARPYRPFFPIGAPERD